MRIVNKMMGVINKILGKIIFIMSIIFVIGLGLNLYHRHSMEYTFTIDKEIVPDDNLKYMWMEFVIVYIADGNDIIILNLHSPGGDGDIAQDIVHALSKTNAITISNVQIYAASAASYIAVSTDFLALRHTAILGFHLGSMYSRETGELLGYIPPKQKGSRQYQGMLEMMVIPLLTKEELKVYRTGGAVFISGEDFSKRRMKQNQKDMNEFHGIFVETTK